MRGLKFESDSFWFKILIFFLSIIDDAVFVMDKKEQNRIETLLNDACVEIWNEPIRSDVYSVNSSNENDRLRMEINVNEKPWNELT